MRLLFLNALKGLKRKALQMIGLIVLIMTSTGIFTMMNSSLDRMENMSYDYIEEQQVEHVSLLLNKNNLLTREDYDELFNEVHEEAMNIVKSDEFNKFKNIFELRLAAAQGLVPGFSNDAINRIQIKMINEIKTLKGLKKTESLSKEDLDLVDKRLVNYYNSTAYLLEIITDQKYVVKDVDVYLLFGSQAKARSTSIHNDINSLWYYFMPLNPEPLKGMEDMKGEVDSLPPAFTQLFDRYNNYLKDKNVVKFLEKEVKKFAEDYNLTYEYREVKDVIKDLNIEVDEENNKSTVIAVTVYDKDKEVKINKPYLIDGKLPTEDKEITLSSNYLEKNNLKIGDKFIIQDKEYLICGSAYISDYIYPAVSLNTPVYDEKYHTVCYATQSTYDELLGKENPLYSARFNDYKGKYGEQGLDELYNELSKDERIFFSMPSYKFHPRISMFLMQQKNNRVMTKYLMIVLLTISIAIIIMVMKKKIDDERKQIGVLKSLGYGTVPIAISYLVYPIVGSIVGGTLGYFLGILLQPYVVSLYRAYFNIPINEFTFAFKYWYLSILIPLITLTLLSFIVALFMLRHRPLKLLNEGGNLKVNLTTKAVTKATSYLPFKQRFKYSLASRSLGKLLSITFSSFATGLLIVLVLIGSTMMNDFVEESFEGIKCKYTVDFNILQDSSKDGIDHSKEDLLLLEDLTIKGIIKDGKRDNEFKGKKLTTYGINPDTKTFTITDGKDRDIRPFIKSDNKNNIIISDPVKVLYKLNIGDQIVLTKELKTNGGNSSGKEMIFNVVGVKNTFSGFDSYVNINVLTNELGYKNTVYNEVYTNELHETYNNTNLEISSIFRVDDLKSNISSAMDMMNVSIYLVITFAGVMALVIISVVSSVVIEENKKHISLMKVMGYKDNEINGIVLNIYTPFVIIAYLLSIPAMKGILNAIIGLVAKDLDFTIPIKLGIPHALLGLAIILIIYFIALYSARRAMNRIPLSEALKRE